MRPLPNLYASSIWWHRLCQAVFMPQDYEAAYVETCRAMFSAYMIEQEFHRMVGGHIYLPDVDELKHINPSR